MANATAGNGGDITGLSQDGNLYSSRGGSIILFLIHSDKELYVTNAWVNFIDYYFSIPLLTHYYYYYSSSII